jgi:hypothetical protein
MAVLQFQISPDPDSLEDWIVKVWEAQNDAIGAEVAIQNVAQALGGGHPSIATIVVNGVDNIPHIIRTYGATSGAKLNDFEMLPTVDLLTVFNPIKFKIGDGNPGTPAANTSTYTNALLIGLDPDKDFLVRRNNYGTLFNITHFTFDDNFGVIALNDPDEFGPNEEFVIERMPRAATTPVNDSVVGKYFKGFINISANTNYDPSHLRNLIRFAGTCSYTFPTGGGVPIGYGHCFNHFGSAGTGTVKFNNGTLIWPGGNKSQIDIADMCEACFSWDGTNWNVVYFNQVSSPTPLAGMILGIGTLVLGNIPVGDNLHTIVHNLNITGEYLVFFSSKSTGPAAARDDDTQVAWYHSVLDKPNSFAVMVGEPAGSVGHDLTLCWMIVKA